MSFSIINPILQTENYPSGVPECASDGICPTQDYRIGTSNSECGSDQTCTLLAPGNVPQNACPFDPATTTTEWFCTCENPDSCTCNSQKACVTCNVDSSIFTSYSNVLQYMNSWCGSVTCQGDISNPPLSACYSGIGTSPQPCFLCPLPNQNGITGGDINFNQNIMPIFCSQPTETPLNCPSDPSTGNPMQACSNLTSNGPEGLLCKRWYNENVSLGDVAMSQYCSNNFNNIDCSCLERARNPVYKIATNNNPSTNIQDACWWIPCKATSAAYLVTSDLKNPECPTNICTIVNNDIATNGGSITVGEYQQYIDCPSGGQSASFWSQYGFWIIGAIVLLMIIVGIIIAIYVYNKTKKTSS